MNDVERREALPRTEAGRWFLNLLGVQARHVSLAPELTQDFPARIIAIEQEATLAAEPGPGLDVERLADAMQRAKWGWLAWTDDADTQEPRRLQAFRNAASAIAAEYARLAAESSDD